MDTGDVSGFRFVYSTTPFAFRTSGGDAPEALTSFRATKDQQAAGSAVTYSFSFDKYDADYHVAVVAYDEAGNVGNYSNVVRVRLPTPTDPTGGPPTGPTGEIMSSPCSIKDIVSCIPLILIFFGNIDFSISTIIEYCCIGLGVVTSSAHLAS